MIDLSRLTPAPWQAGLDMPECANNDPSPNIIWHGSKVVSLIHSAWVRDEVNCANAAFIALARNAYDIMMRRGFSPIRSYNGKWRIDTDDGTYFCGGSESPVEWDCPFVALTEADKWMTERGL